MTAYNKEKYRITEAQAKQFCALGCSVTCKAVLRKFGEWNLERIRKEEDLKNGSMEER